MSVHKPKRPKQAPAAPRTRAKKRWSQNFFQDPGLLAFALEPMNLSQADHALEIGPGHGALTEVLLEQVAQVLALEIDPELIESLKLRFADEPRLELRHQDFMDYDLKQFAPDLPLERRKLIANIPYHLTSPILHKALNQPALLTGRPEPFFDDICLMVQQEVADKLLAEPGSDAWGAISLMVAFAARAEQLIHLPRDLFDPMPRVDSALVRLTPHREPPVALRDPAGFWNLIARSFQLRRKTLRNVLKSLDVDSSRFEALNQVIDLGRRGETLSLQEMAALANAIADQAKEQVVES